MDKKLKSTITGTIITAGIALAVPASADIIGEQYLGIQVAVTDVSNHVPLDNGLSIVATYGLEVPKVHEYFGIEAEYTQSVDHPEHESRLVQEEFEYYTLAGYAVLTIPIQEKISLRGRAGVIYEDWKFRNDVSVTQKDSEFDFSIGGGAIYKFNPDMKLPAGAAVAALVQARAGDRGQEAAPQRARRDRHRAVAAGAAVGASPGTTTVTTTVLNYFLRLARWRGTSARDQQHSHDQHAEHSKQLTHNSTSYGVFVVVE